LTTENAEKREPGERQEAFGLAIALNRRKQTFWRFIDECAGL
jgi:hypothetical protein